MYDIVIIGGGVIGCAIARELKRWRLKVALCERSDDVGAGASKANSAIVHPGHSAKPGTDMARLNVVGNQLYDQLCQELDITFQRCGSSLSHLTRMSCQRWKAFTRTASPMACQACA